MALLLQQKKFNLRKAMESLSNFNFLKVFDVKKIVMKTMLIKNY